MMRHLFGATTILAALMFLLCPSAFASSRQPVDETNRPPIGAQSGENHGTDGELPDDPLGRQLPGKSDPTGKNDGPSAVLQSDLTGKVRTTFEAIRDALHRAAASDDSDLPLVFNESVDRHIRCFTGSKRDVFNRWLSRAKKYEPTIREILRKNDLPEDLVYVAMIESGFNMKARSRARAMGPWQFMDDTGRQYGLRVDYWVDERYDLEKSTVAAARYLKKLFDQFGCWYLVAASYNAGENRVRRAMENGRTKDFWELREYKMLPRETQEYVPQLIAAATIAKDPDRYGFVNVRPNAVFRLTKAYVPGGLPLRDIAYASGADPADMKALNPELLQGITPPGKNRYQIKLPATGRSVDMAEKLETGMAWKRQVLKVTEHRVRAKDSVNRISRLYGVTRPDLMLVNAEGLSMEKGRVLFIPRFAGTGADSAKSETRISAITVAGLEKKKTVRKSPRPTLARKPDAAVALRVSKVRRSPRGQKVELVAKEIKTSPKRTMAKSKSEKT
jgi:membrane-bound lytic murein transglycosylase D